MFEQPQHLLEPVLAHARTDFTTLRREATAQQALDAIRQHGVAEKIVYFHVVDAEGRLRRRGAHAPPIDRAASRGRALFMAAIGWAEFGRRFLAAAHWTGDLAALRFTCPGARC